MKKRIIALTMAVLLIMTIIPEGVFAATSGSYTKVKASQYTKLTQGKLTKDQVEMVIESIINTANYSRGDDPIKLTAKQINKMGKTDHFVNRIALAGATWYDPKPEQYTSSNEKDEWCGAHPLAESNRILSFYTDYRYKKNKTGKNNGYYVWRTNSKRLFYYGGIGYESGCRITSAKKYSNKIVLKVSRESAFYPDDVIAKYTVTLKKQSNGRFKLYSIKETWRNEELS